MNIWRDTYKPARFFIFDGRLTLLVLVTLMHVRWYTLAITIGAALFLWYFEMRRGMDVAASLRMIRANLAGAVRPGRAMGKLRQPIDYGRIR